ncbi:cell surface protein SprA [Roseisolibacter sp. H3M3-2]|nr:cell surface protein SprA [Roseisolibacter sp. H3M3-2]
MESKLERTQDARCAQGFAVALGCRAAFQPNFDFQFNVRSTGPVAERLRLDVDYDSQREFDASNVISAWYEGKPGARLSRFEVGNVSFTPPTSRFLTAGIPSNNYGVQAVGRLGSMTWRTIAAQQKGTVQRDRVFTVGDRTVQTREQPLDDWQIEPRRFFFTIDPRLLPGYPNVDVLSRAGMARLAAALPDTLRPTRVFLYRQLIGAQIQNPRGPRLSVRGARNPAAQTYELLRENVDYYVDPSQLWIALLRPLQLNNERLAVAYEVTINGERSRYVATGGTPDTELREGLQEANLVWEPELTPRNPAFFREMRNVYLVGGEELRRESVSLRIVTGPGGDQEKPVDASFGATYLQMFGLAQAANPTTFDVENRLWPRPQDPNVNAAGGGAGGLQAKLIRNYFVIFPSLQPFARAGLAKGAANPANDTLYTFPSELLYSAQRPQSLYRLRARYEGEGTGDPGTLALGAVQLRAGSEQLVANGRPLVRDVDYRIDYDLGLVTFVDPQRLFPTPTQVTARFEENPLFAVQPTRVFGGAAEWTTGAGILSLTAISQAQRSTFNRPPLGFEPVGSIVGGARADLAWNAPALARAVNRLTRRLGTGDTTVAPARVALRAEFAASKPIPNQAGQAYLETFEGDGGLGLAMTETQWYLSSRPATSSSLRAAAGNLPLSLDRATTIAWQSLVRPLGGTAQQLYRITDIDPSVRLSAGGIAPPEPLLWLTLYPSTVGGLPLRNDAGTPVGGTPTSPASRFRWTLDGAAAGAGRRWRSVRTLLNPGGADLSRVEALEFYALVRTDEGGIARNPTLVFDFGDVSENTLAFVPESLSIRPRAAGPGVTAGLDSLFRGRRREGFDVLDTERDTLTRVFDASVNDRGLPGDRAATLAVDSLGTRLGARPVELCRAQPGRIAVIGDALTSCTVRNNRLDEEDLDQDGQLNATEATTEGYERLRRYVVDLSRRATFTRENPAACQTTGTPTIGEAVGTNDRRCWVLVRIPFRSPSDSLGDFNVRRVRAMRLTMIAGAGEADSAFTTTALARLRLVGAPWLRRAERPVSGIAGDSTALGAGYVIAGVVGTQDSTARVPYQSPPGVTDETDERRTGFEANAVQVNERALRLRAGVPGGTLGLYERAEAYLRFPEGAKNLMTYRTLRLWMRGNSSGWGVGGELNAYVKLGRDEHNFYAYRTPVRSEGSREAWLPEVRVDFRRFYRLRAAVQAAYLRGGIAQQYRCTGADAALIARSGLPRGFAVDRYAACEDGYLVYTVEPNVTPPNLAAVQELAVGFVRVDSVARGGSPLVAGDTLELWVNDLRLSDVEDTPGMAGELGLSVQAGDLADVRVNLVRRDPYFRQLGETPTFATANAVDVGASVRLDRLVPGARGFAMPLSVSYTQSDAAPLFLANSDLDGEQLDGLRTPRDAQTSVALTVRRATPLTGTPWAPLLNNLALTSTWTSGGARSAFQRASRDGFTLRADYDLVPAARSLGLIGGAFRWTPTTLKLTSHLVRTGNRQEAFLKPVVAFDDTARVVNGRDHVWRNGLVVEFQPTAAVTARWDASTLRDLRNYADADRVLGDTVDRVAATEAERARLAGLDVGLERERAMAGLLRFAPALKGWVQPRAEVATYHTTTRDPNARTLLRDAVDESDTTAALRLPRRIGTTQVASAGATVDVGRAIFGAAPTVPPAPPAPVDSPTVTVAARAAATLDRLRRALEPVEVRVERTLSSNVDATALDPSLGLQLGVAGLAGFRAPGGRSATAAGAVTRLVVSHTVGLPLGLSLTNRAEAGDTRSWWRRAATDRQAEADGDQRTLPDLTLRWNWRPAFADALVETVGATAGLVWQRSRTTTPADSGAPLDARALSSRRYPVNGSIAWKALGGFTTAGGLSLTRRQDDVPGSRTDVEAREGAVELAKAFAAPTRWNLRSPIRTRLGWQTSATEVLLRPRDASGAVLLDDALRVVQADNGRRALTFSANSDVAETLTLSLNGSRVTTYNDNLNQRITQTVFSAVLNLSFGAAQLR